MPRRERNTSGVHAIVFSYARVLPRESLARDPIAKELLTWPRAQSLHLHLQCPE